MACTGRSKAWRPRCVEKESLEYGIVECRMGFCLYGVQGKRTGPREEGD